MKSEIFDYVLESRKLIDTPSQGIAEYGDYVVVEYIGNGTFGTVYKAVKKDRINDITDDCEYFALKKIVKSTENDELVKKEIKALLIGLNSPHIIKIYDNFEDELHHFLVLELAKKSFSHIKESKKRKDEDQVRIIITQIIKGLEYLHSHNIIHGDIKLDNVIQDKDGFIKLIDFNSCKFMDDPNDRSKGTPGFAAPEIYFGITTGSNYTQMVDWFSLGVFTFVLLFGDLPFYGDTIPDIYQNISNGEIDWPLDCEISLEAMDFIEGLLKDDPSIRLGCAGVNQIKNHQFFKNFHWD